MFGRELGVAGIRCLHITADVAAGQAGAVQIEDRWLFLVAIWRPAALRPRKSGAADAGSQPSPFRLAHFDRIAEMLARILQPSAHTVTSRKSEEPALPLDR